MSTELTPSNPSTALAENLPDIVRRAGQAAVFAAEEFVYGALRNEHTRKAYRHAVDRFLTWCDERGLSPGTIRPYDVSLYVESRQQTHSAPGASPLSQ